MKILAFGTYDARVHPRIRVLIDGLRAREVEVVELDEPLGLTTAERVRMLRQPWRVPILVARLATRWGRLVAGSRRFRGSARPDAVLVGYLGHFDVLLARALFPRTVIALDHLIFAANTAADRGTAPGLRTRLLTRLDELAIAAADVVVVDTEEHRGMVPASRREDAVVVPVGASRAWFDAADARAARAARPEPAGLSVIFFGLFTPLQGSPTIGRALRLLHERSVPVSATLVGSGQDAAAVHREVDGLPEVRWHEWVDGSQLPRLVAEHDASLGIFGTTDKAMRVVPNKVYQGAAAGTAVITSATDPQRRCLGDHALLVPPGDAEALAAAITALAADPVELARLRGAAASLARTAFTAQAVAGPLVDALRARKSGGRSDRRPVSAPVG